MNKQSCGLKTCLHKTRTASNKNDHSSIILTKIKSASRKYKSRNQNKSHTCDILSMIIICEYSHIYSSISQPKLYYIRQYKLAQLSLYLEDRLAQNNSYTILGWAYNLNCYISTLIGCIHYSKDLRAVPLQLYRNSVVQVSIGVSSSCNSIELQMTGTFRCQI